MILVDPTTGKDGLRVNTRLTRIINSYQTQVKRPCLILALKTNLNEEIHAEFPVVSLNNPERELEKWMREDQHGTKFDTGCTVIITEAKNLDKTIEPKFKNMIWIVLDRLSRKKKYEVTKPLIEMYPNIIAARCPFSETLKVSYYDK